MPRHLILLLCYGFIIWLFRKDIAWRKLASKALLLPGIWIAVQGSRPLSYWFGGGGGESNPINTLSFASFLIISLIVLSRRGVSWGEVIGGNKAVFLIYAYLLCSSFWSEYPFTSLKRLVKDFEVVLVGLVLLTSVDWPTAMRAIFVRVSYILFPLSVVFIKYFPDIGRNQTRAGDNMFTGVTTQKNSLGEMVFVLSIFIIWDLVEILREKGRNGWRMQAGIRAGMLVMALWLLETCDSQTSLLCLILGALTFWVSGRLERMAHGKAVLITGLIALMLLYAGDEMFGISDSIIRAMGRDPTLTGRTGIWNVVLEQDTDHLVGEGFYIFWDTDKGMSVIESLMRIKSTHNGYLEMYVDGGVIGATLLGLLILVAGRRAIDRLFSGHPLGRIALVFWLLGIIYNMSESSFFRLDVLWFTFLLVMIDPPRVAVAPAPIRVMAREQFTRASNGTWNDTYAPTASG